MADSYELSLNEAFRALKTNVMSLASVFVLPTLKHVFYTFCLVLVKYDELHLPLKAVEVVRVVSVRHKVDHVSPRPTAGRLRGAGGLYRLKYDICTDFHGGFLKVCCPENHICHSAPTREQSLHLFREIF